MNRVIVHGRFKDHNKESAGGETDSIQRVFLGPNDSIKQAADIIKRENEKIVVIVDPEQRLLGTVSDQDIRGALLKNYKLREPVRYCMQSAPNYDLISQTEQHYYEVMKQYRLQHLVLLDDDEKVAGVAVMNDAESEVGEKHRIVLMAGGLGSRLRPLTDRIPKPMIEINGKPMLQLVIEQFVKSEYRDFTISINYLSEKIEEYFGDGSNFDVNINYVHETKRLGTAGSLSLLGEVPDAPFFVMNADVLTTLDFKSMMRFHLANDSTATIAVNTYSEQIQYGVIDIERGKVTKIEEKPIIEFFANTGVYILNPSVLNNLTADEYYDMPTLFNDLVEMKQSVNAFPLHEYWMDVGRPDELKRAEEEYVNHFGL